MYRLQLNLYQCIVMEWHISGFVFMSTFLAESWVYLGDVFVEDLQL